MAMKFVPLDGKKDPPANEFLILWFKDQTWTQGRLSRIEFSDKGKEYVFCWGEDEFRDVSHFMQIEPPKNNQ